MKSGNFCETRLLGVRFIDAHLLRRITAVFKLMRYTTEERKLEIKPVLLLTSDS